MEKVCDVSNFFWRDNTAISLKGNKVNLCDRDSK